MHKTHDQYIEAFRERVSVYKQSLAHAREHRSRFVRAYHNVQIYGLPYLRYTLARLRFPWRGYMSAQLFFGKTMELPAADMGAHIFALYGMMPHGTERRLTLWMLKHANPADVVYDVGAHLGFYTALSEALVDSGEVHAFEANGALVKVLERNFQTAKVHIVPYAVADADTEVDFYDASQEEDSSASSRFNIVGSQSLPLRVHATALDTYIASGHRPPTIIKLDIEGGEFDAIIGARNLIQKFKPTILLEVWGGALGRKYSDAAVKELQKYGYDAFSVDGDGSESPHPVSDPVGSIVDTQKNPRDNFVFKPRAR